MGRFRKYKKQTVMIPKAKIVRTWFCLNSWSKSGKFAPRIAKAIASGLQNIRHDNMTANAV